MRITLLKSNYSIPMSNLLSATLRSSLVPVPVTLEFTTNSTKELDDQLIVGAELTVGDLPLVLEIVKAQPLKSQTIKDGRRVGGFACVAILAGCKRLIEPISKAVILKDTSFNAVLRACGAKISLAEDLPLPEFICLIGSMPTQRIALYLQQEAAVMCIKNNRLAVVKIDAILKQKSIDTFDPSAMTWLHSDAAVKMQKSSYVSIDKDGSTVLGDNTTAGLSVFQRAGLDARQLKNMEKVLVKRGTIMRPLNLTVSSGDVVEIDKKQYALLTVVNHLTTGAQGGSQVMTSKMWLASL